jgi:hypothetical protein
MGVRTTAIGVSGVINSENPKTPEVGGIFADLLDIGGF